MAHEDTASSQLQPAASEAKGEQIAALVAAKRVRWEANYNKYKTHSEQISSAVRRLAHWFSY